MEWISVREQLPKPIESPLHMDYVLCLITVYSRIKAEGFLLGLIQPDLIDDPDEPQYISRTRVSIARYNVKKRIWECCLDYDKQVFNADITELTNGQGEIVTHWAYLPDAAEIQEIRIKNFVTWG